MTKSRKKILLSSIAMLLVALVALGSATFAWFTINRSVEAKSMAVTAATADGLELTIDNGAHWGRTKTFSAWADAGNGEGTLAPVSFQYASGSAVGSTGYYPQDISSAGALTSANFSNASNWQDKTIISSPTAALNNNDAKAADTHFAAYRVGIRSSNAAITDVTMSISYTGATTGTYKAQDFIRFIVVDESDSNKVVACYGNGATSTYPITKTVSGETTTYSVGTTAQGADNPSVTGITAPAKTAAAKYYTIYAWFEGQDTECDDNHQGLEGKLDVRFSF